MIKQTFVNMTNLLDIKGTERETPPLGRPPRNLDLEELQGLKQMQNSTIIDEKWFGVMPGCARDAPPKPGLNE
jgi:hypothetical protein